MEKLQSLFTNKHVNRAAKAAGTVALMGAGVAFADGDPTASNISALQTAIIALVGLGAAAGFAVLAASLAPDIGMGITKKWIKKGAN